MHGKLLMLGAISCHVMSTLCESLAQFLHTHKSDASFLNSPIEHYHAMTTIFGTTTAMWWNDRSGNDLISIDIEGDGNGEVNTSPNVCESSHPKGSPKRRLR